MMNPDPIPARLTPNTVGRLWQTGKFSGDFFLFFFILGGFSMLKRCLYGRPVHEYMMDYAQSFWNVYPHVPKLFMAYISDAHEWTGELVQYMDEALVKFLRSFQVLVIVLFKGSPSRLKLPLF